MRTLYALTLAGITGVLVLSAAMAAWGSAPAALVALNNVWLLATVALVVAAAIALCNRFFAYISGGH
ncbi:hypothetical protein [Halalkalicoccus subterraneus]|uniref:hypothetical protein n=1 Tax=Halalkalicoccus subterraneus TaxID=2675002 RepID=UPI000EFC8819|nr:hypothetical protein [Halalkalicoccus subterraneus]